MAPCVLLWISIFWLKLCYIGVVADKAVLVVISSVY